MNLTLLAGQSPTPAPTTGYFHWGTIFRETDFTDVLRIHSGHRVRRPFSWKGTQNTMGGPYNWANLDNVTNRAAAAGVPLLGVLSQTPSWANSGQSNTYPSVAGTLAMYVEFCRQAAVRYRTKDIIWEIYNEPNFNGWTSAQVQEVAIAAANAIHEGNPDAKVAGLVIAGAPTATGPVVGNATAAWTNGIFENAEVRAALDYVSFHNYCRPYAPEIGDRKGPFDEQLTDMINYCNSKGWTGDFLMTEWGYPTVETSLASYTTEENQARFLPRGSVIMASYPRIKQIYQFKLQGDNTPGNEEGGMGLIRANGTDKPAFGTWKTMCSILDQDLISISRDNSFPSAAWVYRFNKTGGKYGYCIWTVTGTQNVSFSGLPSTVRLTSLSGTQQILNPTAGALTITATIDMQYLEVVY